MTRKKTNHEGLHTHRLRDNPAEERFAAQWRKEQEGGRLLQYLMTPPGEDQRFPFETTQRDEVVAATVIQWLGSPVGQKFLRDCGWVAHAQRLRELEVAGDVYRPDDDEPRIEVWAHNWDWREAYGVELEGEAHCETREDAEVERQRVARVIADRVHGQRLRELEAEVERLRENSRVTIECLHQLDAVLSAKKKVRRG